MNEIFDLTNLLLLAVAVLIFIRLRSVLGRRTGNERPRLDPYAAQDVKVAPDNLIPMPRSQDRPAAADAGARNIDDRIGGVAADNKAREPLREIAAADPTFEIDGFVAGAKAAYEMIVSAYAAGDRETLRNLLSPEVYESFSSVIAEREGRGETTEFSFVGISSAEIMDAHLAGRMAHVTVRFVSELVTAIRDRSGEVVEGDVKAVRQVTDIWTFMRDVTSRDPNWRLVATDTP